MTAVGADLRRIFAAHPTGVAAVAALVDGRPVGLAVATFVPVSLEPALVSVCIGHSSTTWPVLRRAPKLGVSVLRADQDTLARALGSRDDDRFAGVDWQATAQGSVVVTGAAAWFDTAVDAVHTAGDHDIVVLRVDHLDADPSAAPLVFHGSTFRRLA